MWHINGILLSSPPPVTEHSYPLRVLWGSALNAASNQTIGEAKKEGSKLGVKVNYGKHHAGLKAGKANGKPTPQTPGGSRLKLLDCIHRPPPKGTHAEAISSHNSPLQRKPRTENTSSEVILVWTIWATVFRVFADYIKLAWIFKCLLLEYNWVIK